MHRDAVVKSDAAYTKSSFKKVEVSTVKLDFVNMAPVDAETHRSEY